jgi:hypothetical protein
VSTVVVCSPSAASGDAVAADSAATGDVGPEVLAVGGVYGEEISSPASGPGIAPN